MALFKAKIQKVRDACSNLGSNDSNCNLWRTDDRERTMDTKEVGDVILLQRKEHF